MSEPSDTRPSKDGPNRHGVIGMALGFLVGICGVLVGTAGWPSWTVAVAAMACGFWWAFGRQLF
ncbi:hypothetical protein [Luteipulveratus mongoliensis]|uniref:Uncharacterized protein n=1 Tax=Luteipulveratus mongoliensis TaxID=571913 RepID=A0A0K1JJ87_9MICO|nr:hypothetical protein [Luteipulveratus mongoliensis]AKU16761.1 hypothetical protein VV02_14260 [Luteipulveratus mongoliensis]